MYIIIFGGSLCATNEMQVKNKCWYTKICRTFVIFDLCPKQATCALLAE